MGCAGLLPWRKAGLKDCPGLSVSLAWDEGQKFNKFLPPVVRVRGIPPVWSLVISWVWGAILLQRTKGLSRCWRGVTGVGGEKEKLSLFFNHPLPWQYVLKSNRARRNASRTRINTSRAPSESIYKCLLAESCPFYFSCGSNAKIWRILLVWLHLLVWGGRGRNPHRNTETKCHFISLVRFLLYSCTDESIVLVTSRTRH